MDKNKRGFTLVELLAVIIILALIMVIAIPSILSTMNKSKRESLYLYAQSIQSKAIAKYTQDLDFNKENINCAVYDIKKDIDISNTGNFEGWVKVTRTATSNGTKIANITVGNNTYVIDDVKTCITKGNECTPLDTYYLNDEVKQIDIAKILKEGEVFCVSHKMVDEANKKLIPKNVQCKKYSEIVDTNSSYNPNEDSTSIKNTYKYDVVISLTDGTYAVNRLTFNDEMSPSKFNNNVVTNTVINKPSCVAGDNETKGTTTTSHEKVTVTTSTMQSKTRETTVVTSRDTTNINSTETTTKNIEQVTSTSSVSKETATQPTTTVDVKNTSILLNNLTVSGYDISFNPLVFYYDLSIPNTTTSLNVTATPMDSESQVQVSGNEDLSVGDNVIITEVFDVKTGAHSYYRINVHRFGSPIPEKHETDEPIDPDEWTPESGLPDPTLEESDASLKFLSISSYSFDFKKDVYDYVLESRGESELHLSYMTSVKGAKVSVTGNNDLKDGSEINIQVISPNGFYHKTYTIKISYKKPSNAGTKILRGVGAGLGVILAGLLSIIYFNKRNNRIVLSKEKDDLIEDITKNDQIS